MRAVIQPASEVTGTLPALTNCNGEETDPSIPPCEERNVEKEICCLKGLGMAERRKKKGLNGCGSAFQVNRIAEALKDMLSLGDAK